MVIPREQEDKSLVIHTDVDNVDNSVNASLSECKTLISESELQYIDDGERKSGKVQQVLSEYANKPTVLVIDDNNDIRQYEHTLLQDDYIVLEAADGKEGLDVAKKEVPDLVICDVISARSGAVQENFDRYYSYTFTHTGEYRKNFGDHYLNVLVGEESRIEKANGFGAISTGQTVIAMSPLLAIRQSRCLSWQMVRRLKA